MIQPPRHATDEGSAAWLADLTPLIDVLFMLIVFLVLSMNVAQRVLHADLPVTRENGLPAPEPVTALSIEIAADGRVAISDALPRPWPIARDDLLRHLETDSGTQDVRILADRRAEVAALTDVLTVLRAQGITRTDIILLDGGQ